MPAQAHSITHAGTALEHAGTLVVAPTAVCPPGVPVQTVTVVNQANASRWALAKVENTIVGQSLQLRAAWGTPCVQFGSGGWPLYLTVNDGSEHYANPVSAYVATGGLSYLNWSSTFSHEVIEMIVDPSTQTSYTHDGQGSNLEVADPVQTRAYRLDGVYVSDFVLPAWYAGGTFGISATQAGQTFYLPTAPVGSTDVPPTVPLPGTGPLIAPADAPGPYDEMGLLTCPWQTTFEEEP